MKRIVIVGATSGIGRATAHLFIEKGWISLIVDRKPFPKPRRNEPPKEYEEAVPAVFGTCNAGHGRLSALFRNRQPKRGTSSGH